MLYAQPQALLQQFLLRHHYLKNMEWKAYVAAKGAGDYQLARSWEFGDYPEPSALLETFTCRHTANGSGYCNPDYDELL